MESRQMLSIAPAPVLGDANDDGNVDLLDVQIVGGNWGTSSPAADINADGIVNLGDVQVIGENWTAGFPTNLPELKFRLDASNQHTLKRQGAAQFSAAAGQFLAAADDVSLDQTNRLSAAFWLNQASLGLDRNIVSKWNFGGSGSWTIGTGGQAGQQGELRFWFANPGGAIGATVVTQGLNLQVERWYHVALVFDGTQVGNVNRFKLFVDGVQQPLVFEAGLVPAALTVSDAPLNVGKWGGTLTRFLDGSIDALGLWSTALSAAQVATLYNGGNGHEYADLPASARAGLVSWWDFDEPTGAARQDATGGGHVLVDASAVALRQIVSEWKDSGPNRLPLTQTYSKRPEYHDHAVGGKGAVFFDGINDALRAASPDFPNDASGNLVLVVQFPADVNFAKFNTVFGSSDEGGSTRYYSLLTVPIDPLSGQYSPQGTPRFGIRWRLDGQNVEMSGNSVIQPGVTYVVNVWGDGPGTGYHMRVNGVDQMLTALVPQPQTEGAWLGAIPGRDNATTGTLKRADGDVDNGRASIAEILLLGPNVGTSTNRNLEQYLAGKWGATFTQTSGLVAAYGFNEGGGTTVTDVSGNGNAGTLAGATWSASGKYGSALAFDGTSAVVNVADAASLDLTTGMTLEAWVRPSTVNASWRDVIYKGVNDTYYLMASSTQGAAPATGGTFSPSPVYGAAPLPANTWSHLAATYDGSNLRLYVNGTQVASRAQSGPIQATTGMLTIGGDSLYGQYFAGLIDEIRIYNRALSAIEIQTDMNTPVPSTLPPDSTPPTVSLTSPVAASTLSHVVALSAAAADNVAVASVTFYADGVSLGTVATAPYTVNWNTTTANNGSHTLTAVAQDAAGNQTTSAVISVNTLNPAFVNEVVVPDITSATTIAFLPDGRLLVGELTETIWIVQPGASTPDPTPFLQLDYSQLFDEQGLMDIALDPDFVQNGYYYIFYTRGAAGQQNRDTLSRFTASGNTTVPGSELVLYQDEAVDTNGEHHGGAIAFGPDGKLYFTTGEHFEPELSQQLTNTRGKVLRINSDGTIPTDNPFYDGNGPNQDAIWAYGLRNPFRMSCDPVTGRMYVGDVGGNDASTAIEEVNLVARGANYGWPLEEGDGGVPGTTPPIYSYPHNGRDASVTGGFVYRGSQFPAEYNGSYFFADYVQNTIKRLVFDANGSVTNVVNFWPADGATDTSLVGDPVKLVPGPDGSIYYVDIGFNDQHVPNDAAIRRIRYSIVDQPPVAVASASPTAGLPPLTVGFSSAGSFDPEGAPVTYAWNFGDGSTSTAANPTHTYQAAGSYVARLTVSDGVNSSLANTLTITVGNPPLPTILGPANGALFRAGDVINYSGSATDPDDGPLPASAFSWNILFHHDAHVHPAGGPFTNTTSGTLVIPASGHDFQGATSYEIVLSVTDSTGLSASSSVTVYPDKVHLAFDSVPSGLTLTIDGISKQTPFVLDDLIGFQRTIGAPAQANGTASYAFANWSDGGAQNHGIVVPTVDRNYLATFTQTSGLVAAYGFNEGGGTTVTDVSGNGNAGTLAGATWSASGKYGSALAFDGTSAVVNVPDSASLDLTTGMTLEAWVRPSTVNASWRDVIYKGVNDTYYLMASSTQGAAPATGGTFSPSPVYGAAPLPANTWSHLAATYDGANLRLYVNGTQVASRAQSGPIQTTTGVLTIGGDSLYGQYFAGLIDEIRIYNRALSAVEIQTDMNTPVGSPLRLQGEATEPSTAVAAPLTTAAVRPLLDETMARWQAALVAAHRAPRWPDIRLEFADLPDRLLAVASATTIFLDVNAAGRGWFVDATPWENSEFNPGAPDPSATERVDLLSVLTHELGHVLGLSDESTIDSDDAGVMGETLPVGTRRAEVRATALLAQNHDAVWAQFAADEGSLCRHAKPRGWVHRSRQ